MFFASIGRFSPRHFIHFNVMVNGIVSLSDFLLSVYRNAKRFLCINFVFCNFTKFIDEF